MQVNDAPQSKPAGQGRLASEQQARGGPLRSPEMQHNPVTVFVVVRPLARTREPELLARLYTVPDQCIPGRGCPHHVHIPLYPGSRPVQATKHAAPCHAAVFLAAALCAAFIPYTTKPCTAGKLAEFEHAVSIRRSADRCQESGAPLTLWRHP